MEILYYMLVACIYNAASLVGHFAIDHLRRVIFELESIAVAVAFKGRENYTLHTTYIYQ